MSMKISTRTRYGVRAMVRLACEYGKGPISVRQIAQTQWLPIKYLEQLVGTLKSGGLVRALRGASGGYILSRAPEEIKISEIFRVLEGSLYPIECLQEGEECAYQRCCSTRDLWQELTEAMISVLDNTTLADLLERYPEEGCFEGEQRPLCVTSTSAVAGESEI